MSFSMNVFLSQLVWSSKDAPVLLLLAVLVQGSSSCASAALKGWHMSGGQYFDDPSSHASSMDSGYVAVLISTLLSKICALFFSCEKWNGCPLDLDRFTGLLLVLFCTELFKGTWPSYFPDWKSFFSQVCYLLKKNSDQWLSSHLENKKWAKEMI